jgi:hypothetical protein
MFKAIHGRPIKVCAPARSARSADIAASDSQGQDRNHALKFEDGLSPDSLASLPQPRHGWKLRVIGKMPDFASQGDEINILFSRAKKE